jgi:hypothetical protein
MRTRFLTLVVALATVMLSVSPALAAANTEAALAYLKTQQNADGGFGSGFTPDSAVGSTADAVQAILSAGGELAQFSQGGKTPLTYLESNAPSASTAGDLSKLVLALVASGQNPRTFGGADSVAKLEALVTPGGQIGGAADTFVSTLLAVLALKSAQRPIPATTLDLIAQAQQDSGGWAWDGTTATAPDTNTTAFAVQALVAGGGAESQVSKALSYYQGIQNDDGGWPYQNPSDFGTTTDANSTAVTIQAIVAAGQDPAAASWTKAGGTPLAALTALQNPSGAFAWKADTPDDNLLATVQALPALAGKAFPLATMAVGEAQVAAPSTVPVTGGAGFGFAWIAVLSGLALAGSGLVQRRKR